ncbi:MAG: hypothetical protein U0361_05565 [Nitrospiraceae bacterium]
MRTLLVGRTRPPLDGHPVRDPAAGVRDQLALADVRRDRTGSTLSNYADLVHPLYAKILGQSIWYAALTTAFCFPLGLPLAHYIARSPARWQPLLLMLVMLPFWTNFLVRNSRRLDDYPAP